MNAKQEQQIRTHGAQLCEIFGLNDDPIKLCKRLRRIENKAHRLATQGCNGELEDGALDREEDKILKGATKILGNRVPIFFNRDPRGYALKIEERYVFENRLDIYRDMGGYGIIAPEFSGQFITV